MIAAAEGIGQTQMGGGGTQGMDAGGRVCSGDIKDWSVDIHGEVTGQNSKTQTTAKGQTDSQTEGWGRGPQTCTTPCL